MQLRHKAWLRMTSWRGMVERPLEQILRAATRRLAAQLPSALRLRALLRVRSVAGVGRGDGSAVNGL